MSRAAVLGVPAALVVALAGCGGDGGDDTVDFSVFILTPGLRDAAADILGPDGPDAPYQVRNEPPSFRYPHWESAFGVRP